MDFDALFYRPDLSGQPVSLLVRFTPATEVVATIQRALALLKHRSTPDEIVLLVPRSAPRHLPARMFGKRVRLVVCQQPDSGEALQQGIAACSHDAIVMTDADMTLDAGELEELLRRLSGSPTTTPADIVTTLRPGRSHKLLKTILVILAGLAGGIVGNFLPWEVPLTGFSAAALVTLVILNLGAIVRFIFGIPVADPGCPVKAVRKKAANGIVLQTSGYLVDLELIAKLTFLTTLIDEMPIKAGNGPANLLETVRGQWGTFLKAVFAPRFWHYDPAQPRTRPVMHAKEAPTPPPRTTVVPARWNANSQKWGPSFPRHRLNHARQIRV